MSVARIVGAIPIVLALAACAGQNFSLGGGTSAAETPDLAMPGRWMLAAPNAPSCGMNFSGAAGAHDGTVAPEGGCPGKFFTSRSWSLTQNALVIKDNTGEPLANLSYANGRFEGQTTAGTPVTLSR
jgi:hypothetical protein